MRLIVTHPSRSIKTPPCCSTSRFIVCNPGRPWPPPWSFSNNSAAAACYRWTRYCHTDVNQVRPWPLTEVVRRERRCCSLPLTRCCPTDVATRPSRPPTVSRSPTTPLLLPTADPLLPHRCRLGLSRPLPRSFTGSAAAVTYSGPAEAPPMSPRSVPASPRPFTGSAAAATYSGPPSAAPTDGRPCHPRLTAPPMITGEVAAAACCRPAAAQPMSQSWPSRLTPQPMITDSSRCCGLLRSHRCCPTDDAHAVPGWHHRRWSPMQPLLRPVVPPLLPNRWRPCRPGWQHRRWSPMQLLLRPVEPPLLPHRCRTCRPRLTPPPMITDAAAAAVCCALAAAPPMSPEQTPATCADARWK